MAAIKRLDTKRGQGAREFRNELKLISTFHHQNIISFIGYCVEDNEIIIVLKYAINGSLDRYLGDANKDRSITWAQRLKICLGAARGLNYLHSGLGDDSRVIHIEPKSGNILLDDNMKAKVCDFGLSVVCPRNQPHIESAPAGTPYYADPIYIESRILRKDSDVYSFGVVLFEMLSGMLAYESNIILGDDEEQRLIHLVKHHYDDGLEKLIDPRIRDHIVIGSFNTFKEFAYQCISLNLTERPTMDRIVHRIKKALNIQVPPIIVGKIFTQLFLYINIQVFHSILLYRECCTFSNGKCVEAGLKALQQWCWQEKEEHVTSAMEKLVHLKQAVTLLVIMNEKYSEKSFVEIYEDICPCLSLQQLYRICSLYRDDNNCIPSVTRHVISSIEMRGTKDLKNEDINSFILQDYSSEPFSVGDLFTSPPVKDFAGVTPPLELAKYSALRFLFD